MLKGLYEGVVMTEKTLIKTFEDHGMKRVWPIDEKFDPKHNKTSPEGSHLKCNETIAVDKVCVDGTPWKPHYAKMSIYWRLAQCF